MEGVFVYIDNITVAGKTQEHHDHNVRKFLEVAKEKNLTFNEGKTILNTDTITRSEERRVGKECRARWSPNQ